MTSEVPIIRQESRLHNDNDNDNDKQDMPLYEQGDGDDSLVDVSTTSTRTENYKLWTLDDIEGVVLEILDDITIASAGEAMEKVASSRMFGFVAAWGTAILQEALVSAIAPTGDVSVDSNDPNILNNSRLLLGRSDVPLETLDPPKSCPDDSYQRGQIPVRAAKYRNYDGEDFHHAVKTATRSQAYPASLASSRMTTKSKMRKKQHGVAATNVELTGPQPGVPFSTDSANMGRHRVISPRKSITVHHPTQIDTTNGQTEYSPQLNNINGAGLQLSIDTELVHQENSGQSPSPLSKSSSSTVSARRRPHPPGSARNEQAIKTFSFGEKEEEVKVEYVIQKLPPRKNSMSSKSILPNIDSRRTLSSQNARYPAFTGGGDVGCDSELVGDDPFDQHFHSIPLSPGVKIRVGSESNDGPDLPLFASRMRRSTFARMDTCKLPTQYTEPIASRVSTPNVQPNQYHGKQRAKETVLTETASDSSTADSSLPGDQQGRDHNLNTDGWVKSDDVSSAEIAASCACGSSSSMTLFRKQGKVQRPCRSCNNKLSRAESTNFTDLVKQRAFHVKPTCLPTSSSPSKRAPGVSPRRVMSAPASSPLARRNLLFSKNAPHLHNRDLDSTTPII